jgi:hypothetical protein
MPVILRRIRGDIIVKYLLFVPCIVGNQFTTANHKNVQCSSVDISIIRITLTISTCFNAHGIIITEHVLCNII